jgi:hypothetical protein
MNSHLTLLHTLTLIAPANRGVEKILWGAPVAQRMSTPPTMVRMRVRIPSGAPDCVRTWRDTAPSSYQ